MTIDEAIARERQVAEKHRNNIVPKERYHNMPWIDENNEVSMRSAEEHEQLAEWLEDYKQIKMLIPIEQALKAEYNKAIDDFVNAFKSNTLCQTFGLRQCDIEEIAEQLKEGEI